jgi:phosphoribosylglycinamide formyltransferase 2
VTLVGQNLSEFELHLRAMLGLPIPEIRSLGAAASRVILSGPDTAAGEGAQGAAPSYLGREQALGIPDTQGCCSASPNSGPGGAWGWPWPAVAVRPKPGAAPMGPRLW